MEIKKIPLSLVTPSPMNPRKTFDEEELQELADNIEKQGLLQPITVRPIKDKKTFAVVNGNADFHPKYEIICGERRFRAFSKLYDRWIEKNLTDSDGEPVNGFYEIPAIIREMNDDEAFDAMITENLQRKDVDPIEEAFAFGQLIQKGNTAEEVALRFGKSIRFVNDRIKLNSLIPDLMLAVREGKMPLVAAMIIAKLDESDQERYCRENKDSYYGMTKDSAERFVNNLFMSLDKAVWSAAGDADFSGGCEMKCAECKANTLNHGCLFREMKSQHGGKCTDRTRFEVKTKAYILDTVDRHSDQLVKKGMPLEFGKTVVCMSCNSYYVNESAKRMREAIHEAVLDHGFEVVDPSEVFSHLVSYDNDDERVEEMLREGRAYRCLSVNGYYGPEVRECRYYVRLDDSGVNTDADGTPLAVSKILESLRGAELTLKAGLATAGVDALDSCVPVETPLNENERTLLLTCMLTNNYLMAKRIGVNECCSGETILAFVREHPEKWAMIMRAWMFKQLRVHANLKVAESMLDEFGALNCPEAYQASQDKVRSKFKRTKTKAEKKLNELGYGLDGKPLE